ncbi:unnamed protein product [Rodentolepis nana]|uniref:Plus3 domain-containing protein n=1 Tax=Rodentolepis nana TaxID=102285 RepID=A0A0R3T5F2_RODNA|nr:unnamed protein product [Rodentolepis nana]
MSFTKGLNQERIPELKLEHRRRGIKARTKEKQWGNEIKARTKEKHTLRHSRLEENSRPQGATNSKLDKGETVDSGNLRHTTGQESKPLLSLRLWPRIEAVAEFRLRTGRIAWQNTFKDWEYTVKTTYLTRLPRIEAVAEFRLLGQESKPLLSLDYVRDTVPRIEAVAESYLEERRNRGNGEDPPDSVSSGGNGDDPPDSVSSSKDNADPPDSVSSSKDKDRQRYWEARRQLLRKARDTGKQEDSYYRPT